MQFDFRVCAIALVLPLFLVSSIACQKNDSTKTAPSLTKKLETKKSDSQPENEYAGVTLDTWKDRLKNFEPENESSLTYIPGLQEIVKDETLEWHVRKSAAFALARVGEPAKATTLPILLKLSEPKENPEETQVWAGKAIAKFGPSAASTTPQLRERVLSQQGALIVRLTYIDALSQIGTSHPLAIPTLIEVLQSSNGTQLESTALREAALLGLMSLGPAAAPATLALIDALADSHEGVRSKATMTIEQIGPLASPAAAPLAEMIILEDSLEARNNAAKALTNLGPSALPLIEQLINDEDILVRRAIAKSVAERKRILPELQKTIQNNLADDDNEIQLRAIQALLNDSSFQNTKQLLSTTVSLLESKSRTIRVEAIELLVKLPIEKKEKLEKIEGLRDHPKREIRSAIKEAIKRLSKEE